MDHVAFHRVDSMSSVQVNEHHQGCFCRSIMEAVQRHRPLQEQTVGAPNGYLIIESRLVVCTGGVCRSWYLHLRCSLQFLVLQLLVWAVRFSAAALLCCCCTWWCVQFLVYALGGYSVTSYWSCLAARRCFGLSWCRYIWCHVASTCARKLLRLVLEAKSPQHPCFGTKAQPLLFNATVTTCTSHTPQLHTTQTVTSKRTDTSRCSITMR